MPLKFQNSKVALCVEILILTDPRVDIELLGELKTMILYQVWQNKMYDLRTWAAGMCYTYNPPNKSDTLLTSRFDDRTMA